MPAPSGSGRASIHVVIINYESSAHLAACLDSLAEAGVDRVLVWDNKSSAGEQERLDAVVSDRPNVRLYRSPENLGFGSGVNHAVDLLTIDDDDFIWVVNPDVRVHEGAFTRLADAARRREADIFSPIIAYPTGEIWYAGGLIDERRCLVTHTVAAMNKEPFDTQFVTGAAFLISAAAWRCLGGFRADLFLYWEDVDLSLRAVKSGFRLAVIADAIVTHYVGGSGALDRKDVSGKSEHYYYYMARNRFRVFCAPERSAANVLLASRRPLALLLIRAAREREAAVGKVRAALRGVAHGLTGSGAFS